MKRLISGSLIALWAFSASAAEPTKPDGTPKSTAESKPAEASPEEYRNWIEIGVGNTFTSGDRAAYMRRSGQSRGLFGGVEDFHLERDVGKRGLFQLDGRGIFDNHDYDLKLNLSHPEVGYLRGGYREYRTWYDGSGGFSPRSNAWVRLYNEELALDRRQAWFEGGLTLPDWPQLSLRYLYDVRSGAKDSTIWGDYNLTLNPANQVLRGIVPTFREIDERRHIVDADLKHAVGDVSFGLGMRYERDEINNSLNILRRPDEPTRVRAVTQRDQSTSDIFNGHAWVEMRLNPKLLLTLGDSYTRLDTDIGGSRIYGASYNSPFDPLSLNRQANDEGFIDLGGGSQVDQYVVNLNLMYTPLEHVTIVPSIRLEHQEQSGAALFTETRVTNATNPPTLTDVFNTRVRRFTDISESLELRYTGWTNWSFFARGEWLEGQSRLKETEFDVEDEGVGPVQLQRDTDSDRFVQKYTLGANWYPHRKANFGAQYYYRSRRNDYDHLADSTIFNPPATNNLYPAFIRELEFNTHDVNFRMTLRPRVNLTLVSRYDFQVTSYNMRGDINTFGIPLSEIQSAHATSHIFSQNLSWTPFSQLYFQGSVNYALQRTDSPVSGLTGTASNLVQNARNNYWNASALVGYVLTKASDIQAQYTYYRADNYDSGVANQSLPLGAGAEQHGATVTLLNRLRQNLLWKIQYGYFRGFDETSGGHNNYQAHLVYSSLQMRF